MNILGGGKSEQKVNAMGSDGRENIIHNIKQGGNNNINLNVYNFDCINLSVALNTDYFGLDFFDSSVDPNTNFVANIITVMK